MLEIRWHGRGGQGVVTAAELLAVAATEQGLCAQAFPFYGPERRGAPVLAFTRLDQSPIEIRAHIYSPDVVVCLDPRLMKTVNITEGLKEGGYVILNSPKDPKVLKEIFPSFRLAIVDATSIALEKLKVNITNTAMLGAVARATNIVPVEAVRKAASDRFGEANGEVVEETFAKTVLV